MKQSLLIKLLLTLSVITGSGSKLSAQCTFSNLNTNYCTNSSSVALTTSAPGGTYSGNGIITGTTGVFSPSLAGPGTATINYNYCSTAYSVSLGTFSPQGTTGNTLTMTDDSNTGTLSIGFSFKFFCNTFTTFNLCSNGWMSFNSNLTSYPGPIMPTNTTPNNVIAFAWADLNPGNGGTITYTTVGSAPNRTLLVNFLAVPHYTGSGNAANPITTQVKLMETSNLIEIHTTSVVANGIAHTMGIQNGNSSLAYTVAGRNAATTWSATNECYRWTPGPSCAITQTTIVSPSTISIVANNSICIGTTATLTANGNSTYTWSTASNANIITDAPSVTTTYSVSGTNSYGCVANSVITVTVDQTPTVTATSSSGSGICPGRTLTLNGGGASAYSWTGSTPTVTNNVPFTLTSTTPFTVTGTNACGTATAAISVSIHPAPSVTPVASTSSLCSGSTLSLTGVGNATTYVWSNSVPNGTGFTPNLSATYTVVGTSALSCTASATIFVTVVATPSVASVLSPSLICLGKSSTLTASGAASYSWSGGAQTGSTAAYVVTPTVSGISTFTIMRANSTCTTSQLVTIIVNGLPVIQAIANPTLVCSGKATSLTVAGGSTFTWTSPGAPPAVNSFTFTGATPLAFPIVPSTYTVAASDGTCVNTTTVFVQANPNPTITTSASSATLCSGLPVTLTANGGDNYTVTSSATSNTYNAVPVTETLTGTSAFIITGDNSYGCTSSSTQYVTVNANPSMTVTPSKTLTCSGGSVNVTTSGANTYLWDNGATTTSTTVYPVSSVSGPVIFTVTGTFTNTLCHTDKTVAISVFIPTIVVSGNTTTCLGGDIALSATGGTITGYRWYTTSVSVATSSTNAYSGTLSAPAIYTLTALTTSASAVLCASTKTFDVNVFFNPTITATAPRTQICYKESAIITAHGGDTYLWNTGINTPTVSVAPSITTIYTVTGTDINGCTSTGTIQVKVSGCSGIAEQTAATFDLSVYPNPSNGEFVIQSGVDLKLTLVNDLGQLIRVIELSTGNNYNAYVNDLAKGIYFLSGQKDNVQINQKVIISK